MDDENLYCDDCYDVFDQTGFGSELDYSMQCELAREEGWRIGGMFNFCPDCQSEENGED